MDPDDHLLDELSEAEQWYDEKILNPDIKEFTLYVLHSSLTIEDKIDNVLSRHFLDSKEKWPEFSIVVLSRFTFGMKIEILEDVLAEYNYEDKKSIIDLEKTA